MDFSVKRKAFTSETNIIRVLGFHLLALFACLILISGCGGDDNPTNSDCEPVLYTGGTVVFSYGLVSYNFNGVAITDSFDPLDFLINPDICGGANVTCEGVSTAICYGGTLNINLMNPMSSTVDLVVIIVSDSGSAISTGTYSTQPVPLCGFMVMEDVPVQEVFDNIDRLSDTDLDAGDIEMIYAWAEELAQYTKFNVFGGTITCSTISGGAFSGSLSGLLYGTPDGGMSIDYANGTFNLDN